MKKEFTRKSFRSISTSTFALVDSIRFIPKVGDFFYVHSTDPTEFGYIDRLIEISDNTEIYKGKRLTANAFFFQTAKKVIATVGDEIIEGLPNFKLETEEEIAAKDFESFLDSQGVPNDKNRLACVIAFSYGFAARGKNVYDYQALSKAFRYGEENDIKGFTSLLSIKLPRKLILDISETGEIDPNSLEFVY